MNRFRESIHSISPFFREVVLDERRRNKVLARLTYFVLASVALFMSVVNAFTAEYTLLIATGVFSSLCFIDFAMSFGGRKSSSAASVLFIIEILTLMIFFLVSGHPKGFSVIWSALLPTCGLCLFGFRKGTIVSGTFFVALVFFFWTPLGRSLLVYQDYGDVFMLRFPMLYLSFFALALGLEGILSISQQAYANLSHHDPLTGALNRSGFSDILHDKLADRKNERIGFIIADLDHFKVVNDKYGHSNGDRVLIQTVQIIKEVTDVPLCRWGGEEFAIFVPDGEHTEEIAENIRRKMEETSIRLDGTDEIRQTLSLGAICVRSNGMPDYSPLCKAADTCLYEAKETGRNRVIYREAENCADLQEGPAHE
ncbi:MAG: GGDEF domain-containing protein [Clostridia bacterium]|nr:GGDEF domain-containing protein [Clostridia bacterium]